jgi:hypothetical protein
MAKGLSKGLPSSTGGIFQTRRRILETTSPSPHLKVVGSGSSYGGYFHGNGPSFSDFLADEHADRVVVLPFSSYQSRQLCPRKTLLSFCSLVLGFPIGSFLRSAESQPVIDAMMWQQHHPSTDIPAIRRSDATINVP